MAGRYEHMKYQQQQQDPFANLGKANTTPNPGDIPQPEYMQPEPDDGVHISNAAAALFNEEAVPSLKDRCRAEICPTCAEKAEAEDIRLRALAEMDNFKKRMQRERDEQIKYAAEPVLHDLLPVLDNLELAIRYAGKDEACRDLLTGVSMTHKILLDAVKQHGLVPVGGEGEAFNPDLHEAVAQEPRQDMPPGHITVLHQRGYTLKERLLRPAKVSVSVDSAGA